MEIVVVYSTLEFFNAFSIYDNAFIKLYCYDVFSTAIVLKCTISLFEFR